MQNVDILLVEDNDADVVLVREALKDAKVYNNLHVVNDGEQALDFLRHDSSINPAKSTPGLILLDLYMPKLSGMEVLEAIKNDPKLRTIPVVMMTSSREESDVVQAYELQANCYVIKPVDFEQMITVIKSIENFWLSVVQLPMMMGGGEGLKLGRRS
jgi:chemotaxis family two-component system response regulator Rcp1